MYEFDRGFGRFTSNLTQSTSPWRFRRNLFFYTRRTLESWEKMASTVWKTSGTTPKKYRNASLRYTRKKGIHSRPKSDRCTCRYHLYMKLESFPSFTHRKRVSQPFDHPKKYFFIYKKTPRNTKC